VLPALRNYSSSDSRDGAVSGLMAWSETIGKACIGFGGFRPGCNNMRRSFLILFLNDSQREKE